MDLGNSDDSKRYTPTLINVDGDGSGCRIDKIILQKAHIPHSLITKLMRSKKIFLNSLPVKELGLRVSDGDVISIKTNILSFTPKPNNNPPMPSKEHLITIRNRVRYEDENLAIIDKPWGVATQGGTGIKNPLDNTIRAIWGPDTRLVHRLDKDTSGLIVVAKNISTARKISEAFKNKSVHKEYLAVVYPVPANNSGTIETNIAKDKTQGRMQKYQNAPEGKKSITHYTVIKSDTEKNIALVRFRPQTGRTHQIRLHAQSIGCPIVGDFKYRGNCNLSNKLHLLAYAVKIEEIFDHEEVRANIPSFFIFS